MVIRIVRPTRNITTTAPVVIFTKLLGARLFIVMARTQRGKLVQGREALCGAALFAAVFRDRNSVVNYFGGYHFRVLLQTNFAEGGFLKFQKS